MDIRSTCSAMLLIFASIYCHAGDATLDAAIGGGMGGAIGAAIGNEVGGREGAIIGGAVGAATGTAIATDETHEGHYKNRETHYHANSSKHGGSKFCPPGQAKKGNC